MHIVFVSSTYRDLKFERRYVIQRARSLGFTVICMEDGFPEGQDWERWSKNAARKADIFIRLVARRSGTEVNSFASTGDTVSFVEDSYAHGIAFKHAYWHLLRPFPDEARLFQPDEEDAYKTSRELEDKPETTLEQFQSATQRLGYGERTEIRSVDDLDAALEEALKVSRTAYLWHRFGLWRTFYFKHQESAHLHQVGDESPGQLRLKTILTRPSKRFALAFGLAPLLLLFGFLQFPAAALATLLYVTVSTAAYFAFSPCYIYWGTRSLITRGPLALRVRVHSTSGPLRVERKWRLLDRLTGVGAMRVTVGGKGVFFLPFVEDPFDHDPNSKPTSQKSSC